MKRSRFTEDQIIGILKEHEAGVSVADLCRKHGVSDATVYKWKAKYGGMDVSEAKRLKGLEDENARLKRLLADAMLDNAAIQIDEALVLLDRVRSDLELDPDAFEGLERRLSRLHELARKHRIAPEQLAAHRDSLAEELVVLRTAGQRVQQLDGEIDAAKAAWQRAAAWWWNC